MASALRTLRICSDAQRRLKKITSLSTFQQIMKIMQHIQPGVYCQCSRCREIRDGAPSLAIVPFEPAVAEARATGTTHEELPTYPPPKKKLRMLCDDSDGDSEEDVDAFRNFVHRLRTKVHCCIGVHAFTIHYLHRSTCI